jgi:UDP-GlcNAc:undecaprenyl-phosphate GlcNAc-1-phosphate transferase
VIVGASVLARSGVFVVVAFATAALFTPLAMRVARRVGMIDVPHPHKFHHRPTPYLGGVAILASIVAVVVASFFFGYGFTTETAAVVLGGAIVAAIGVVDDWLTIGRVPRLTVQALAGAGLWIAGVRVQPAGVRAIDLAVTVLVVLAVTNAVNLLDNMDGLSAGTVVVASLFAFVAANWQDQQQLSLLAIALAGGCLGFLIHNFNPARVFLGDAGALFMGFVLAGLLLRLDLLGFPPITRIIVPLLIGAVPLFDMALVVVSRWRAGRPLSRGGTDHFSHRLIRLGLNQRQVALATYAAGGLTGGLALALIKADSVALSWTTFGVAAAVGVSLIWLFERVDNRSRDRMAARPQHPGSGQDGQGSDAELSLTDP